MAPEKIVLETCGFHQKLGFNVLFNFAYLSNLAGRRSRSLICSRNLQKIISKRSIFLKNYKVEGKMCLNMSSITSNQNQDGGRKIFGSKSSKHPEKDVFGCYLIMFLGDYF
jgi:hypothetical protein